MEIEYINEIANYIKKILYSSTAILWSWGAERYRNIEYNSMPALRFKVNGYLHKGDVVVALNEGLDCFEVYCLDENDKIVSINDDVYCNELVDAIDKLVETKE